MRERRSYRRVRERAILDDLGEYSTQNWLLELHNAFFYLRWTGVLKLCFIVIATFVCETDFWSTKSRKIKRSKKTFQISCITWARWAIKKYLRYCEGWGYEKPLSLRSIMLIYCDTTISLVTYKLKFAWLAELFYWFHKVAESGFFLIQRSTENFQISVIELVTVNWVTFQHKVPFIERASFCNTALHNK